MADENVRERMEKWLRNRFRTDYIIGRLDVPAHLGTPHDFKVNDIHDLGHVFTYFDNPEEAKEKMDLAVKGVNSLQDYLRGLEFLRNEYETKPEIEIHYPKKREELDAPKLDSFEKDNRVIVKAVKEIFRKWDIEGEACFGSDNKPFRCTFNEPIITKLRRNYWTELSTITDEEEETIKEYMLNIQRCPIVFNCSLSKLVVYAILAYDVLLNQLEPFTSHRVLEGDLDYNDGAQEWLFNVIKNQKRYEEELVTNAIIRQWLAEIRSETGYDLDRILGFRPIEFPEEQVRKSFQQVQEKGPEEILSFYCSDEWNLEHFLEGCF